MAWHLIVSGLLLLLLLILLIGIFRRPASSAHDRERLRYPRKTASLLRKLVASGDSCADSAALQNDARVLLLHLVHLQQDLKGLPALPAGKDGEPRLMKLARDVADQGDFSAASLSKALSDWDESPTPRECFSLPLCVAAAEAQRLFHVLKAIEKDLHERRQGRRFAARLIRAREPQRCFSKCFLPTMGVSAVLQELQSQEQTQLLALADAWLEHQRQTAKDILLACLNRQLQLAEEIRRTRACFEALARLTWPSACCAADPVHHRLLHASEGEYEALTPESQLSMRLQLENVALRLHVTPAHLMERLLMLCHAADPDAPESLIGFYLWDPNGLPLLRKALSTHSGQFFARLSLRPDALHYALLLGFSLLAGFTFVQLGEPVFMLPAFLLTVGCLPRSFPRRSPALPSARVSPEDSLLSTLIVIHAEFASVHDAIHAVRRLKTIRHILGTGHDYLLLGDFTPAMTAVTSDDLPIIQAAISALRALEAEDAFYLQRGRSWDSASHCYRARAGRRGAVGEICRLAAQGECADTIAYATLDPASLDRRYAYILSVPSECTPSADMLPRLLEAIAHPLNRRSPSGARGYSILTPEASDRFQGLGLIRPDAYLEATDGFIYDDAAGDALAGELAGVGSVQGVHAQCPRKNHSWENAFRHVLDVWRLSWWQLPWVQTPCGLVTNPLSFLARFRLREELRSTLIPLGRLLLMLYAILTRNRLVLAISFLTPDIGHPVRSKEELLRYVGLRSLLPACAVINSLALLQALFRPKLRFSAWNTIEIWAQLLFSALIAACAFVIPGFFLPCIGIALLFAGFPLAHRLLAPSGPSAETATEDDFAFLEQIFDSSWRFFTAHVTAANRCLPPCFYQPEPELGSSASTSPEAIGAYLLACVCAKEAGRISANDAASRLLSTVDSLANLSRPFGLPCHRYALPTGEIADRRTDASGTGVLLAALMTTAQALRAWLPELSSDYASLSAQIGQMIQSFDMDQLYDAEQECFFQALDEDGQGVGHVSLFSDSALLLCVAACALGSSSPALLRALERISVRLLGQQVPCSRQGGASDILVPRLFLPLEEADAISFLRAMEHRGQDGLFGQDHCFYFAFDPALRHRSKSFGIPEAALENTCAASVYAPHAAALGLPYLPHRAAQSLKRFQKLGALSPEGFCDSVDFQNGPVCVRTLDAYHQGLTLISAAHVLAGEPVRRYFCEIPEIEALLPFFKEDRRPLVLPALKQSPPNPSSAPPAERVPLRYTLPPDLHSLGTKDFHLISDANGSSTLYAGALPLTKGMHGLDGPQFYLVGEEGTFRLGGASAPCSTVFAPGEVRCEQICGSIRATLVTTIDIPHRRALHIIQLTNLSTRDRLVDLASFLLPASQCVKVRQPEKHHLIWEASPHPLHHTMSLSIAPLLSCVCTDLNAFLGRCRTLHAPVLLDEPPVDLQLHAVSPCMSFRARCSLGGRGQLFAWFTTGLMDSTAPAMHELPGIRTLAALQHQALQAAADLSPLQTNALALLNGPVAAAGYRLALSLDSAVDLLADVLAYTDCCLMQGLPIRLCIVRPQALAAPVDNALKAHLAEQITVAVAPDSFDRDKWPLVLQEQLPLDEQLGALYRELQLPARVKSPIPALLPEARLRHANHLCGFDPETGDLTLRLQPGAAAPVPWENMHKTRRFTETVTDAGLNAELNEQVFLCMADGVLFQPWSIELPRMVHFNPNETIWETWTDSLDVKLTAFPLPSHPCGLRILQLRNASDHSLSLTVSVTASPGSAPDCVSGFAFSDSRFLGGEGWDAFPMDDLAPYTAIPALSSSVSSGGMLACLQRKVQISANASVKLIWLCGFARHSEDAVRAIAATQAQGAANLLHRVRSLWASRLSRLTIITPEDSLNALFHRMLSVQAWHSAGLPGVSALVYLDPAEAKRRILLSARDTASPEAWAALSILLEHYVLITQDEALLDVNLPRHGGTLFSCCCNALLSVSLDRRKLPEDGDAPRLCFLLASAARALNSLRPVPSLTELSHSLLTAADLHLWQEGHYGTPLRLDYQHLAALAYGNTPRVRQALSTCWAALYDQPHGLLRFMQPDETQTSPGTPLNGGMVTLDAVYTLRFLLHNGLSSEAFELLAALNPLHHADTPERQEVFRLAPNRLPGGLLAAPLPAGQAVSGGDEAAALLYAVILEDVLGFHREGNRIRMVPHVPSDWDGYTIALQEGSATWRISVERRLDALIIDGNEAADDTFTIHDDGRIHRVRVPLH